MLEKLYTTKMSEDKKALQKRFSVIRSRNKKSSKLIALMTALILSLTLLSGIMAMAVLDSNEKITEEYVLTLIDYKIFKGYPDGKMRLDDTISNAEAISLLLRSHREYSEALEIYTPTGQSENHWAYKEIALAKDIGIAQGDIAPDEGITVSDFSKMLVILLGYGEKAEQRGGDYVAVAKRPGILEGVDKNPDDFLTRRDAALMLSNALDVPFMEAASFNANTKDVEFIIAEEKTLRSLLD